MSSVAIEFKTVLGLDVGERRVGVALANNIARLASAVTTLERSDNFLEQLQELIKTHEISLLVLGLPRNLSGRSTAQTAATRRFAAGLQALNLPIVFQDEAATSIQAQAELRARRQPYQKPAVDALAAVYILEDFLQEHSEF